MLYENATARTLAGFRIFVFGLCFFHVLRKWPIRLDGLPTELFTQLGVLRLIPEAWMGRIITQPGLFWLTLTSLLLILLAALGCRPFKLFGPLAALSFLLVDGLLKGYGGFVNHAQTALLTAALILAVSSAADALSPARKCPKPQSPAAYQFPLLFITAAILFCYTFIGTHRLIYGGLGVFSYEVAQSLLVVRSLETAESSFRLGFEIAQHPFFVQAFRVGFLVSTLIEISSLYCLFNRKFALGWLAFMVIFHFMCLFTMNIFFWENILLLCFLFYRTDPRARTGSAPAVRQRGET